jgi:hypothetical protein
MARYEKKPERAVKSDTNLAKQKLKSIGYGKDTSVAEEGGEES